MHLDADASQIHASESASRCEFALCRPWAAAAAAAAAAHLAKFMESQAILAKLMPPEMLAETAQAVANFREGEVSEDGNARMAKMEEFVDASVEWSKQIKIHARILRDSNAERLAVAKYMHAMITDWLEEGVQDTLDDKLSNDEVQVITRTIRKIKEHAELISELIAKLARLGAYRQESPEGGERKVKLIKNAQEAATRAAETLRAEVAAIDAEDAAMPE